MTSLKQGNVVFVDFSSCGCRRESNSPEECILPWAKTNDSEAVYAENQGIGKTADQDIIEGQGYRFMSDLFTKNDVSKLLGVSEARLKYWNRTGFLKPSGARGSLRYYTFQDLISIRAVKSLLDQGVSLQRARRLIESLQKTLPNVTKPLNELRIVADGRKIVVTGSDSAFEPESGQILLDFNVKDLNEQIVDMRHGKGSPRPSPKTAFDWYLLGCSLDENPDTVSQAEAAYFRALELDPGLANAYTNLGNIYYRRNQVPKAREMYLKALEVDPRHPEAHYNLGFLFFDMGQPAKAVPLFENATLLDPDFADAYFNLAMSLFECGRSPEARPYWERYLSLEPQGPWAEMARQRLREIR